MRTPGKASWVKSLTFRQLNVCAFIMLQVPMGHEPVPDNEAYESVHIGDVGNAIGLQGVVIGLCKRLAELLRDFLGCIVHHAGHASAPTV